MDEHRNIADRVTFYLLDQIRAGALGPGDTIRHADIEAALGVSRTPVREAVQRLISMGLVETAPQRFTRVVVPDRAALFENAVVWEALFRAVLEETVPQLDEPTITGIEAGVVELEASLAEGAAEAALFSLGKIFGTLREKTKNSHLRRSLATSLAFFLLVINEGTATGRASRSTSTQIVFDVGFSPGVRDFAAAIRARDSDAAAAATRRLMNIVRTRLADPAPTDPAPSPDPTPSLTPTPSPTPSTTRTPPPARSLPTGHEHPEPDSTDATDAPDAPDDGAQLQ